MIPFQVVYSEIQVSDPNQEPIHGIISPSAGKPRLVAKALFDAYPGIEFLEPLKLTVEDFCEAHDTQYVNDIFAKRRVNGFGTLSDSVNASLPYTSGAMFKACQVARPDRPACALVSGFHHAGYKGCDELGYFCTFNGLMISALKWADWTNLKDSNRVAIIDCDMHYGNGTQEIIDQFLCDDVIYHNTFGDRYLNPSHADRYLEDLDPASGPLVKALKNFNPGLIIYQSGADVHVDDPYGGVLTEEQMIERDRRMFTIAKELKVPLAWCLAGGYQTDPDGGCSKVIRFHMNTFKVCEEVYGA